MIRVCDFILSLIGIFILLPVYVLLGLVMVVMQGWPVIFSQSRSGKDFHVFKIYKLRTMEKYQEDKYGLTTGYKDKRITKLGFWLRKYKIDELPQFFNILKGDMSVVGSRPQVPYYTEKYKSYYSQILKKRPGLLSPAAIKYSNEDEVLEQKENAVDYYEQVLVPVKCEMDIEMVKNFSTKAYWTVILDFLKKTLKI